MSGYYLNGRAAADEDHPKINPDINGQRDTRPVSFQKCA